MSVLFTKIFTEIVLDKLYNTILTLFLQNKIFLSLVNVNTYSNRMISDISFA